VSLQAASAEHSRTQPLRHPTPLHPLEPKAWPACAGRQALRTLPRRACMQTHKGGEQHPCCQLLRVKKAANRLARAKHARRRAGRNGRRGAAAGAPEGCRQSAARPRRPPSPGWRTGARRRRPPPRPRTLRPGAPGRRSRRRRPRRCRRRRRPAAAAAGPQGPRAARGPQEPPSPRLAARPTAKPPAAASSPAHS